MTFVAVWSGGEGRKKSFDLLWGRPCRGGKWEFDPCTVHPKHTQVPAWWRTCTSVKMLEREKGQGVKCHLSLLHTPFPTDCTAMHQNISRQKPESSNCGWDFLCSLCTTFPRKVFVFEKIRKNFRISELSELPSCSGSDQTVDPCSDSGAVTVPTATPASPEASVARPTGRRPRDPCQPVSRCPAEASPAPKLPEGQQETTISTTLSSTSFSSRWECFMESSCRFLIDESCVNFMSETLHQRTPNEMFKFKPVILEWSMNQKIRGACE